MSISSLPESLQITISDTLVCHRTIYPPYFYHLLPTGSKG